MAGRVDGRTAVVTGAAGGLGAEFCAALASEGAPYVVGVDVVAQDETRERVEQAGGRFIDLTADITSEEECTKVAARVREEGGATILVNNAGVFPVIPFLETTLADWRRIHSLNVEGTFLMTRALLPQLLEAGWDAWSTSRARWSGSARPGWSPTPRRSPR